MYRPAVPGVRLIGSSRKRRLAVWTCSGAGMSSGAPAPVPAARETDPLCPTAIARGAAVRSAFVAARDGETVATAAHGFDRLERALGVELLAQAADEDFEHVGIAVEVLLVDVLGEVGLRDQFAGVH